MKRNKWQRLATIGLCSSLVINAFSGVTAVAETVTIESSPTAESSAKEETPASSVKEETTKASTENSQVTTDTSQEEATKEAEKQAETATSEAVQPNPLLAPTPVSGLGVRAGNLAALSPQFVELAASTDKLDPKTVSVPSAQLGIVFESEDNASLNMADFSLKTEMLYNRWGTNVQGPLTEAPLALVTTNTLVAENTKTANGFDIVLPSIDFVSVGYISEINALVLKDPEITIPKYIDSLKLKNLGIQRTIIPTVTGPRVTDATLEMSLSKEGDKYVVKQPLGETWNVSLKRGNYAAEFLSTNRPTDGYKSSIRFYTAMQDINLIAVHKKVTEKFVNTSGVAITPPTGFTQNKKTPMTSNDFTFKQAGTLPDTYTTGGKTYKFKGWYKGKTKPSTLTTTKAPSYQVTYDDNDDLNVVYEEVVTKTYTLPSKEITFGYVDEKGNLINPANFTLKATMSETTKSGTTTPFSTITGTNVTTTNLKKLTIPQKVYTLPESVEGTTYGTQSVTHEIPKYYRTISISPTATYTGDKTKYPLANEVRKEIENPSTVVSSSPGTNAYELGKTSNTSYNTKQYYWTWDTTKTLYAMGVYSGNVGATYNLATPDKTVYYYLENRRVTENFVDTSGAKITPPTGFTQGKQTAITSDPYTFKQAGTLPDTYTTGGKTYKFKGWYKGKSILNTLTTTKAPSYQVTYDDNDDLNVVYEEETVTTIYPSINLNFVNEKGGAFTPALTFSGKYYVQSTSANLITNLYDVTSKNNGSGQYTVSINNGSIPLSQELLKKYNNGQPISATNRLRFNVDKLTIDQQLKYVDGIQVDTAQSSSLNYYGHKYTSSSSMIFDPNVAPTEYNMTTEQINSLNFSSDGTYFSNANNRFFNMHLGHSSSGGSYLLMMALFNENPVNQTKLVYKVTRKQVTENFVDANGAKITAPTGFTQGNQVPMNSNTFKYTAAKALPATYTAGGKVYTFQGWYKGKTKPSTLNKTTTPTFNATFDGNDDMTAMYKEEIPTASVTLTRPKEVIDTNTNVIWTTTITNTSKAPLQNLTLKKGPNWSAGLTIPTFMEVTPEGETTKSIPVNSTLWTEGVSLPNAVPIGKKVSIAFTTRATGKPNTVLKAEVVVFGGIKDSTVDNFVRIRPNDQEVVTPTTEGFISVPTFDFGQVGVAGSKQQHSLKQAADYYGNGTRNPYVRIKKTQPNWSLTAQLSQPKSATDSLPTATRLLLGAAPVSSFTNYNQPTELKNAVGTTNAISLTANNTATSIIANKQFTGSNVYQLDFTFNNVKLEVPANQGIKGQQYKAAVTWNLVTGP